MKISIFLSTMLIFLTFSAKSQNFDAHNYCGFPLLQKRKTPNETLIQNQFEKSYVDYFSNPPIDKRNNETITLPIAFHVIHNNGPENISEEQILQGLHDLNDAFANVGYYNPSIGVETGIQFCLAKQTPDSSTTTGIKRVKSIVTDVEIETSGFRLSNLSHWDSKNYINIWIVKQICSQNPDIGCNIVAYASSPIDHGKPADGIVIEYPYVGSSPAKSAVFVHEMGHYLGLYHTFKNGCENSNCLMDGDAICDTPPDNSTQSIACDTFSNTCHTDVNPFDENNVFMSDQNDMIENYMDYGNIDCLNTFTLGQKDRMRFVIEQSRNSLVKSITCCKPITAHFTTNFNSLFISMGTIVDFLNTSQGDNLTYEWYINDQKVSLLKNFSFLFEEQGIVNVELKVSNTCYSLSQKQVFIVSCQTKADFTQSATNINPEDTLFCKNESENANQFQWYIDHNLVATSKDFQTTFTSGTYDIQLIANDSTTNCKDTITQIITVSKQDETNLVGIPIWFISNEFINSKQHIIEWKNKKTVSTNIPNNIRGPVSYALDDCGHLVFYSYTNYWTPINYINNSNGHILYPNSSTYKKDKQFSNTQIVKVPDFSNEWYIISIEKWTHQLFYSRVRMNHSNSIEFLEKDIEISIPNSTYADDFTISASAYGQSNQHFLVSIRVCNTIDCNEISLDKWLISSEGISFIENSGALKIPFPVRKTKQDIEINESSQKIAVSLSNEKTEESYLILLDLNEFSNHDIQTTTPQDLILVKDGTIRDISSLLPINSKIKDILNFGITNLGFLENLGEFKKIEFSPNGHFLYIIARDFHLSYYNRQSYLVQLDLKTYPFQARILVQKSNTYSLVNIQSSIDENLYFTKSGTNQLFVLPNPNDFMPQALEPGDINFQTWSNEENITFPNNIFILPNQIDGFDYLSNNHCQNVELILSAKDCSGNCLDSIVFELSSDTDLQVQTIVPQTCPDTISVSVNSQSVYSLQSKTLQIKMDSVIVEGNVNDPIALSQSCCNAQATFNDYHISTIAIDEIISFKNTSSNANNYQWLVNNEWVSESVDFNYSFSETGVYDVKLVAQQDGDCTDTSLVKIVTVTSDGLDQTGGFSPSLLKNNQMKAFGVSTCDEIAFFVQSLGKYLFISIPNSTEPTNIYLNASRYDNEIQVVKVPNFKNQWYIIYCESNINSRLLYSKIEKVSYHKIIILEKDVPLTANGETLHYWFAKAISPSANDNPHQHFLYACRKNKNENSISLDRWLITENGITFKDNSGMFRINENVEIGNIELSHTGDKIAVTCQTTIYAPNIIIYNVETFNNNDILTITPYDLTIVADGEGNDISNILPIDTKIKDLNSINHNLQYLSKFENVIGDIEFSPNGRFIYAVLSPLLIQIDLNQNPLQIRLQIEKLNGSPALYPKSSMLQKIQSCNDGNLYFTKKRTKKLFVIPNPNDILPQNLEISKIDLSTSSEPNIISNSLLTATKIPEQIDGFNYMSNQTKDIEIIVESMNCDSQCIQNYHTEILVDDFVIKTLKVEKCPDTLHFCIDTNLIYSIRAPFSGIQYDSIIIHGQTNQTTPYNFTDFSCCGDTIIHQLDTFACANKYVLIGNKRVYAGTKDTIQYKTKQGCNITYFVNVDSSSSITTNDTIQICQGETAMIFGFPRTQEKTYSWTYKNVKGCDSTSNVTLVVHKFKVDIESNMTCNGMKSGNISILPINGLPPYIYQWNHSQKDTSFIDNLGEGYYAFTITDGFGCKIKDSFEIKRFDIKTSISKDDVTCFESADGSIYFHSGSAILMNSIDGISFSDASDFTNLPAGNYDVIVTDGMGCEIRKTISITEPDAFLLDLHEDKMIEKGDTIYIIPTTNRNPELYEWTSTKDIDCLNCPTLKESPQETTQFTLKIEDKNGCLASDSMTVFVNTISKLFVPNIFSPNGDGNNDIFSIFGKGVKEIVSLHILNRDQQVVFKKTHFKPNNQSLGWNGQSSQNVKLDQGVYFYRIDVQFLNGKTDIIWGDVTLIR